MQSNRACKREHREYAGCMRDFKKLLTFPREDKAVLVETAEEAGWSVNELIVRCVHGHLPVVKAELSVRRQKKTPRVTNVDPLPRAVLRKLYDEREEDQVAIQRMIKSQ